MIDEPADLERRLLWLSEVRKVGQWARSFGFVFCLIGVILLTYATYKIPGGPRSPFGYTSLAVIAVGWVLLFVSMAQRSRYVRAHPFEPKA